MSNARTEQCPAGSRDGPPASGQDPSALSAEQKTTWIAEIKALLRARQAAGWSRHCYTDPEIQALAEEAPAASWATPWRDGPGLAADHAEAQTLTVAGVRFMGETSKILESPSQAGAATPTLEAECLA